MKVKKDKIKLRHTFANGQVRLNVYLDRDGGLKSFTVGKGAAGVAGVAVPVPALTKPAVKPNVGDRFRLQDGTVVRVASASKEAYKGLPWWSNRPGGGFRGGKVPATAAGIANPAGHNHGHYLYLVIDGAAPAVQVPHLAGLKVGDRVRMSPAGIARWGNQAKNTVGTVERVDGKILPVTVRWDHGHVYSYNHDALIPEAPAAPAPEPHLAGFKVGDRVRLSVYGLESWGDQARGGPGTITGPYEGGFADVAWYVTWDNTGRRYAYRNADLVPANEAAVVPEIPARFTAKPTLGARYRNAAGEFEVRSGEQVKAGDTGFYAWSAAGQNRLGEHGWDPQSKGSEAIVGWARLDKSRLFLVFVGGPEGPEVLEELVLPLAKEPTVGARYTKNGKTYEIREGAAVKPGDKGFYVWSRYNARGRTLGGDLHGHANLDKDWLTGAKARLFAVEVGAAAPARGEKFPAGRKFTDKQKYDHGLGLADLDKTHTMPDGTRAVLRRLRDIPDGAKKWNVAKERNGVAVLEDNLPSKAMFYAKKAGETDQDRRLALMLVE